MHKNPTKPHNNDCAEIIFDNPENFESLTTASTYTEEYHLINLSNGFSGIGASCQSQQPACKSANLRIKAIPHTDTKIVPHPLLSEKSEPSTVKKFEIRSIRDMNFESTLFESKYSKYSTSKMGIKVKDIIKEVITNIEDPNITIKLGDVNFSCHWEVLLTFSKYFEPYIFKKKIIELPKDCITAIGFDMAYQWMISDQPMLERKYLMDLFQAANFLQMELLISHCWLSIDNDGFFAEDRAFAFYLESRKTNLKQLRKPMLHRVSRYFLPIVATFEFLDLQADELCVLLCSNALAVNSELEVFFAALKWLLYNWDERNKYLEDVLMCVRFKFVSPLFLVCINKTNSTFYMRAIAENKKLHNEIISAIQYSTIHTIHGYTPTNCVKLLEQYKLTSTKPRKWLHDLDCDYHHSYYCQRKGYFAYEKFLKYLEKIADKGQEYWRGVSVSEDKCHRLKECCILAEKKIDFNDSKQMTPRNVDGLL